jgi:putative colanic acid biosynthesis acetyltransferase WcaF
MPNLHLPVTPPPDGQVTASLKAADAQAPDLYVDLSAFRRNDEVAGKSKVLQAIWVLLVSPFVSSSFLYGSGWRIAVLRLFGAKIGRSVVLKPGLRIKYPWHFEIGDNSWVGEACWIDNLAEVRLGKNVCISQGVYFCTGNHDWTDTTFAMSTGAIVVNDGAWIAARCTIGPGVDVGSHAIALLGSLVIRSIPDSEIQSGNPACYLRRRVLLPRATAVDK